VPEFISMNAMMAGMAPTMRERERGGVDDEIKSLIVKLVQIGRIA
jgi:hypothetical protein